MDKSDLINKIEHAREVLRAQKEKYYSTHFYEFNKDVLGWPDIYEPLHKRVCDFVQDNVDKKKLLMLLPRGSFKCVSPDTRITIPNGNSVFADDLEIGDNVLSWSNGFKESKITAKRKNSKQDMVKIKLRSGNTLKVSHNHPIMTIKGFVNAEELNEGKRVMVWAGDKMVSGRKESLDEMWLLGLIIGDGACTRGSVTIADKDILHKTTECCKNIGTELHKNAGKHNYSFKGIWGFMRKWGIANKTSWHKNIPDELFDLDIDSRREFIAGYFSADGTITKNGDISFTTVCDDIAYKLQELLKTIGVFSIINHYKYSYSSFYRVDIRDPISKMNFLNCSFVGKQGKIRKGQDGFWRSVPKEWRDISKPKKARKRGFRIDNNYDTSFTKFSKFSNELGLSWVHLDSVVWDEVVSVEKYVGESIDIEVEDTHIFIAEGVVTHNSSIITVGYTLWRICKNPNERVMIANATYPMAVSFLKQIKDHLSKNEVLKEIYGDLTKDAEGWRENMITLAGTMEGGGYRGKEPTVSAYGMESNLTGSHFTFGIMDDMVNRDNINTREQLDKPINFFKDALDLIDPINGRKQLLVIGTTWHQSDLYSWIEDPDSGIGEDFAVLKLPAYEGEWGTGKLLFPTRLGWEQLEELKRSQGSSHFAAQYLLNPVPREDALFKFDFKYYDDTDLTGLELNKFIAVDPALSDKKSADYSAMVCVGVDKNNTWYILDIWRDKVNPGRLIDQVFYWDEKWKPTTIGMETVAFQKILQFSINDEMRKRNRFIPIKELPHHDKSKDERIRGLEPRYETGTVFHKKEISGNDALEDELRRFPRGKNDDLIDALASILEISYPPRKRMERRPGKYKGYPA